MTMMSRSSSESSFDEQESTVASKNSPKKPLDLSLTEDKSQVVESVSDCVSDGDTDCSDMPSLSTYRVDEMSASIASRSTWNDCDMSIPSLSSFRPDDISMTSSCHTAPPSSVRSYRSTGSDSDSDLEKSSPGSDLVKSKGPSMPSRRRSPGRKNYPADVDTSEWDRNYTDRPTKRRQDETEKGNGLPNRRPMRTVEVSRGEIPDESQKTANSSSWRKSGSPDRTPVERTESFPLSSIKKPAKQGSGSSSSLRAAADGSSSSSLRGGDSLPRLPRRTSTSTLDVAAARHASHQTDDDENDDGLSADDASDSSSAISSRISDDSTDGDEIITIPDSDDSSSSDVTVQDSIEETTQPLNERIEKASETKSAVETSELPSAVDVLIPPGDALENKQCPEMQHAPSRPENSSHKESSDPNTEVKVPRTNSRTVSKKSNETESQENQSAKKALKSSPKTVNEKTSKPSTKASGEKNSKSSPKSTTEKGTKVSGPKRNRKSPTSVRSIEDSVDDNGKNKRTDESGTASAEESGTSATETEVDDSEEVPHKKSGEAKGEKKKGILRQVSRSFSSSFRMIGRTASKLKNMAQKPAPRGRKPD